ncbi:uncharacterized protein LOC121776832 [Salvia splendens]|uniref:uncharacterized protein LOC121776832 n=1 Tax=Salvia splendens TaxID=180675 RepID=UPI001C273283|nr:uncharacterized protein LOC121776832 [Salvia splendens]
MEAFAMFAAVMGKSVPTAPTSSAPPPETVQETTAEPEAVAEPTTAVSEPTTAETREDEADLAAGLELLAVSAPRLGSATEGETPVLDDRVVGVSEKETPVTDSRVEGETPVLEEFVEGKTPVDGDKIPEGNEALDAERNVEGETPEVVGGDKALITEEDVREGETPEKSAGTETHVGEGSEGIETPVYFAGVTPLLNEEGEALGAENVQEPVDVGGTPPRGREEKEGKQIAPSKTKKAKGKSTESPLPRPAKVSYAAEPEDSAGSSESEEEQEEELNFEPTEIWITSKLLDEMRKFDDPKRATIHKEKSA